MFYSQYSSYFASTKHWMEKSKLTSVFCFLLFFPQKQWYKQFRFRILKTNRFLFCLWFSDSFSIKIVTLFLFINVLLSLWELEIERERVCVSESKFSLLLLIYFFFNQISTWKWSSLFIGIYIFFKNKIKFSYHQW